MARYSYKGLGRTGRRASGSIEANDEAEARAKVRLLGVKIDSLQLGGASGSKGTWRLIEIDSKKNIKLNLTPPGVGMKEVSIFTRQFSVLINAGVSVVQGLEMLAAQVENPYLKEVITSLKKSIQSGSDLSTALAKHPDVFSDLYCSLVSAGAASGSLDVMLDKLSGYLERANKLRSQFVGAISYPLVVIVVAAGLLLFELLFIVPMFEKFFADSGQELPQFTKIVIGVSHFLINNIVFFVAGCVAAGYFFNRWARTPAGRLQIDSFSLKIPVLGMLLQKIALARFASTMATLIAGGVGLIETLEICARASGNLAIERDVLKIKTDVSNGQSMADSMGKHAIIPVMMSGMVRVGEASGQLNLMFTKISQFYEEEVDTVMAQVLKLMEPLLFIVLGLVIGVVLIAMYLPIFDLASSQAG